MSGVHSLKPPDGASWSFRREPAKTAVFAKTRDESPDEGKMLPMATKTVAYTGAEGVSSDERWSAWVARGVEHDRKIKKRAIAIAAAVATGAAMSLVIFLLR